MGLGMALDRALSFLARSGGCACGTTWGLRPGNRVADLVFGDVDHSVGPASRCDPRARSPDMLGPVLVLTVLVCLNGYENRWDRISRTRHRGAPGHQRRTNT